MFCDEFDECVVFGRSKNRFKKGRKMCPMYYSEWETWIVEAIKSKWFTPKICVLLMGAVIWTYYALMLKGESTAKQSNFYPSDVWFIHIWLVCLMFKQKIGSFVLWRFFGSILIWRAECYETFVNNFNWALGCTVSQEW